MNNRRFAVAAGIGCSLLFLAMIVAAGAVVMFFVPVNTVFAPEGESAAPQEAEQVVVETPAESAEISATQVAIPTLQAEAAEAAPPAQEELPEDAPALAQFYRDVTPGVVSVRISTDQSLTGTGAGSGFILNEAGHIVTNNHVVAAANQITVIFHDGFEAPAEIVGTDDDSDLAVIQVDSLPENVRPLPVGDSDQVTAGEQVVAIGNPFGYGGSMTTGIVSAVGRIIPSGVTRFSIPQAIQTDAAINPGNSGGPLLNMAGEVIGVNAQIRTAGSTMANSGVGFAIPSNVVRLIAPVLIEEGSYEWPYLGVEGGPVGLAVQRANDLPNQQGAYIHNVVAGTPAAEAGMQGTTGTETVLGQEIPVGGDVVVSMNGEPVIDFADLLTRVAFSEPGEEVTLTVMRDGEMQELSVVLATRPESQN
ncbi:MAG: trypsin-like peptidase domain-containing protein [Candidatus Promineifilaceae bacterium]|nr:trypsin-like peptidase domain-containing protein [Candidatus Promineifilaceae bacterium]